MIIIRSTLAKINHGIVIAVLVGKGRRNNEIHQLHMAQSRHYSWFTSVAAWEWDLV